MVNIQTTNKLRKGEVLTVYIPNNYWDRLWDVNKCFLFYEAFDGLKLPALARFKLDTDDTGSFTTKYIHITMLEEIIFIGSLDLRLPYSTDEAAK